jgi:hypothetical protein
LANFDESENFELPDYNEIENWNGIPEVVVPG